MREYELHLFHMHASALSAELVRATHDYFATTGHLAVHTPILSPHDAEGAGEMFHVGPAGFFGEGNDMYLTVSGQLEAEMLTAGVARVYTMGPTFRAERSVTRRHLAEFWMVEAETAFASPEANRALVAGYIAYCARQVEERCQEDVAALAKGVDAQLPARLAATQRAPLELTHAEAVAELTRGGVAPPDGRLGSDHEQWLCDHVGDGLGLVMVRDYPAAHAPFYMRGNDADEGATVANVDVLSPVVGELAGGSAREERLGRLEAKAPATVPAEYMDLRRFGSVPHAGFGVGFDRLVQHMTGLTNIRDVVAFPRSAPQNL